MPFIRTKIGILTLAMFSLMVAPVAVAVSCTTQSQMTEAERNSLVQSAKSLAALVQNGDVAGLKAMTIPSVAERFDSIAAAVESASPLIQRGSLTVEAVYLLNSSDLKTTEEETQFFCGGANAHEVVLTIPRIPPGKYALTVLHASGVDAPQVITFILSEGGSGAASWKLAGSFIHPLTSAGHDGVWYWNQAREFARKKQNWNAYFYYQTAAYLLAPVYFISSPNLDKLLKEQAAVAPPGLPTSTQPMLVSAGGQNFEIDDMHTDSSLGSLDLVIDYKTQDTSDPVASRTRNIDLMKALLAQHPELKDGFHGLWAYANAPNQRPFANELAMGQIQ
ncbi:hypothetical protein ACPOL_4140 [Acidisarcina polymorpha]|uniref:Lipoprotein n=1 Tax=Acidisarcina polymorpha TaxID=2211140 RepID=A0A2Z5G3X8_9BACT|nr:hypothetical protein [Acidisarcina polymorpha]AXC13417.1 hypothetical protein ACPOL_4140 [Acidisarcina polymorpha]